MNKIYKYNFISKFKTANILSFFLVLASLALIFFKGLNFGIDFKGGTLIELRVDTENIKIKHCEWDIMIQVVAPILLYDSKFATLQK